MSEHDSQGRTWLCSVVFLDITGYTGRPVEQQIEIKQHFQDITSNAMRHIPEADRILIDTGDGAALCFFGDPEEALFAALGIRAAVVSGSEMLATPYQLRIGINLGPVKVVQSISGQRNPLGDGINNAQRVMGFAQPNQILVGRSFYDVVACLSREHAQIFHYLGERRDKHVKVHEVYEVRLQGDIPGAAPAAATAASATGWSAAQLDGLGAQLAAHIGPMAKVLVQRAALTASSLDDLYQSLGANIQSETERRAFLGQRVALLTTTEPEPDAPALQAGPSWRDPERLAQLASCLAEYLGPLARILVNKAAQSVDSETALMARLAEELENDTARQQFQEAARRILRLPN